MVESRAQRTLVKSPPELWAEISDPQALARHLGEFGEIRITRLEPETAVAWEGDIARGTVALEPSGWGTKVTLTAAPLASATQAAEEPFVEPEPEPEPAPEPALERAPEPEPEPSDPPEPQPMATGTDTPPEPEQRRGFFARLFGRRPAVEQTSETPAPEPVPAAPPAPAPLPEPTPEPEPIVAALPVPVTPPEVEPSVEHRHPAGRRSHRRHPHHGARRSRLRAAPPVLALLGARGGSGGGLRTARRATAWQA